MSNLEDSTSNKILAQLDNIIEQSLHLLPKIGKEDDTCETTGISLIYPKKRCGDLRISEQEAKLLLCKQLFDNKIQFAVEVPTRLGYAFEGENERSGRVDICVYDEQNKRLSNIEYKAHNSDTNFKTDFVKLLQEEGQNYFVHILKATNNGTLYKEGADKRIGIVKKYITTLQREKKVNKFTSLTLYICILDPFVILKNTITRDDLADIESKLKIAYEIKQNKFKLLDNEKSGWHCISL